MRLFPVLDEITEALRIRRFRCNNESELQETVHAALQVSLGPNRVAREVNLVTIDGECRGRVDFLIDGNYALELKTQGTRARALRQAIGYLGARNVLGLVLASSRASVISRWPAELAGRPVRTVHLRSFP